MLVDPDVPPPLFPALEPSTIIREPGPASDVPSEPAPAPPPEPGPELAPAEPDPGAFAFPDGDFPQVVTAERKERAHALKSKDRVGCTFQSPLIASTGIRRRPIH